MTSIEWLDEQLQEYVIAVDHVANTMVIQISFEEYIDLKRQAKEMHKQEMEISDEEIEKSMRRYNITDFGQMAAYVTGAKWYREKLKQRQ
jgi:stress response protein SCP2